MKVTMHPSARDAFQKKAETLKLLVSVMPEEFEPKSQVTDPNIHVVASFDKTNIIGEFEPHWTDFDGNTSARAFEADGQLVGIQNQDYKKLRHIAEDFQKALRPEKIVGMKFLERSIFDWVKRSFRHEGVAGFTDFVIEKVESSIIEGEVWVPISFFRIAHPITIGNVNFQMITKKYMDEYEVVLKNSLPEGCDPKLIEDHIEKRRRKLQNTAVAIVKLAAEPDYGYQVALETVEKSLSVLRFFSGFSTNPSSVCYAAPMDKQHPDGSFYMIYKDGKVVQETDQFSGNKLRSWIISAEDHQRNCESGLLILDALLKKDKLTDFEESLLNALDLYSKSTLSKQLSDRLTYLLIALETLFLKDGSEPIQENLSLRMAYMQPVSVEERRDIVENVKEIYKLRSKFIHHGQNISIEDLEKLKIFWWNAWMSFLYAIQYAYEIRTRKQYFEEFDNRKFGA